MSRPIQRALHLYLITVSAFLVGCSHPIAEQNTRQSLGETEFAGQMFARQARHNTFTAYLFLEPSIYAAEDEPFLVHEGVSKYASYLAMNIPFGPVDQLRKQLESILGSPLNHRGEAHITVITPPEFERLAPYVSISEINILVRESLQKLPFLVDCIGRFETNVEGSQLSTYFFVVRSTELSVIRKKIAMKYRKAGGAAPAFIGDYHPHITIGYSLRDLHASDGAVKNGSSCMYNPTEKSQLQRSI